MGLPKFTSLRPDVVLFKDKLPHNICVQPAKGSKARALYPSYPLRVPAASQLLSRQWRLHVWGLCGEDDLGELLGEYRKAADVWPVKWLEWIQKARTRSSRRQAPWPTYRHSDPEAACLPSPLLHQGKAVQCIPYDAHYTWWIGSPSWLLVWPQ